MSSSLPINAIKTDFIAALKNNVTLLLSAPPGAGKSTQLPLWLLEQNAGISGKIYLLQPRRIAAKNIACYLASQLGEAVGKRVGYRLRNEVKVSKETQLEVITEGILTQIVQNDPELTDCDLVIFDEFHERSVHADLAFALCREVQQGLRDDLKLVIMSATLNIDYLMSALPDAKTLSSEGRTFPIEVTHVAPSSARQWREHALKQIKQQAFEHQGSTLVFLPGVADIRFLAENLEPFAPQGLNISPLYGDLSLKAQQQALAAAPSGQRKIVLATNIAETSLTIEGVDLVIDSGLEKVALFDHTTLTNKLSMQAIAKSSAVQRAGRAGRLAPGRCIRLFSEEDFSRRAQQNKAEIFTTDLLPVLIEAARWGVTKLADLPLIETPLASLEESAWSQLIALNIVDSQRRLNAHGKRVSQLACHPRFGHMIISAQSLEEQSAAASTQNFANLTLFACLVAALLEERDLLAAKKSANASFFPQADFRLRVYQLQKLLQRSDYRAKQIAIQAERLFTQVGKGSKSIADANKLTTLFGIKSFDQLVNFSGLLLALAYPERLAKQRSEHSESYISVNGKGLNLNQEDPLINEPVIAVANCMSRNLNAATSHNAKQGLTVTLAAAVDIELLLSLKLVKQSQRSVCHYDNAKDKIVAEQQTSVGELVLTREKMPLSKAGDAIGKLWLSQIEKNGIAWLNFSEQVSSLLARWRWVNTFLPQLDLPKVDEPSLFEQADIWFLPFVSEIQNKNQLKKLDFSQMLLSLLDYNQQQLFAKVAPTHFVGPTKRRCPIRYHAEQQSPIVSLPMQELYGQQTTPSVGENQQIPLVLELLSPAQRPIQTTQDLVSFWQGSYKDVQKDMKSRYPKHYWPDDPANAQATNKTKRHIKES